MCNSRNSSSSRGEPSPHNVSSSFSPEPQSCSWARKGPCWHPKAPWQAQPSCSQELFAKPIQWGSHKAPRSGIQKRLSWKRDSIRPLVTYWPSVNSWLFAQVLVWTRRMLLIQLTRESTAPHHQCSTQAHVCVDLSHWQEFPSSAYSNEIIYKQKESYKVVYFCSFCSPPLLYSSNKVWPWEHGEQTVSISWGGLVTWAGRVSLSTRPAVCHITARQKVVWVLVFTVPGPDCVPRLCWIFATSEHEITVLNKMYQ